tara:strand:+ start:3718 stop:4266 length:549 start_codon:yes stop_codon:yes gene_type:complete
MAKTLFILPFLIFFGVITYFAIPIVKKSDPKLLPSALVDRDVPQNKLPPLSKSKRGFDHEDLMGGETLVNFFSSWCGPCRVEHDLLMKISKEKTVRLFGINYKDQTQAAINWLNQLGDPFERIVADKDGRAAIDWGVYGVPETYLIDKQGKVRYRHVGPLTERILEEKLMPIIQLLRNNKDD